MSIVSAHFHLSFLPPISRLLSHQVSHRTILLLCTRNYPQTRRQRNFHRRSPPGSIPQGLVRLRSCRYSALIRGSAFTKWGDMAKSISSSVSPGRAFKYKKPFSIFSRSVRHPQGVQNSPHIPGYATLMKRLAVFRTSSYFDVAAAREIGIQFHGNAGIIHRKWHFILYIISRYAATHLRLRQKHTVLDIFSNSLDRY